MLDGKILSAVLATLTAVAVSSTGGAGDLSDQGIETDPGDMEMDIAGLVKNPLQQLREMATTTPTPSNSVYARLEAANLQNESLQVKGAQISPQNVTKLKFGGQVINSDEDISIHGYSGSITPANSTVMLSGTAQTVLTSGVNLTGTSAIEHSLNSRRIEIKGVEESSIALSQVSGTIESSGTSTTFNSPRALSIDSFSGDITLNPSNSTLVLDGKVNRLSAGDFEFGE